MIIFATNFLNVYLYVISALLFFVAAAAIIARMPNKRMPTYWLICPYVANYQTKKEAILPSLTFYQMNVVVRSWSLRFSFHIFKNNSTFSFQIVDWGFFFLFLFLKTKTFQPCWIEREVHSIDKPSRWIFKYTVSNGLIST